MIVWRGWGFGWRLPRLRRFLLSTCQCRSLFPFPRQPGARALLLTARAEKEPDCYCDLPVARGTPPVTPVKPRYGTVDEGEPIVLISY